MRSVGFCPSCDYAIAKAQIERMQEGAFCSPCPRCGENKLFFFYSYGSQRHRERWEGYVRGEVKGNPVAFPTVVALDKGK